VARMVPAGKKPRIRKSAPTLREKQEAARIKEEEVKPKGLGKLASRGSAPFKKLRLRDRQVTKTAARIFRPLKKALSWIVPRYFVNSWREVRKVVWPNRRETWRLTLAVFVFAVVFGAMVAGVDKGLDEIFKKLVLK
jgi:preprotein translocase SecE subunit